MITPTKYPKHLQGSTSNFPCNKGGMKKGKTNRVYSEDAFTQALLSLPCGLVGVGVI